MNPFAAGPLGRRTDYAGGYDPGRLFPIARAEGRATLGLGERLPFVGADWWNAYELGWLDRRGKPRVMVAAIRVPADSPRLIESKSLKLYLNGLARTRFDEAETVRSALREDLGRAVGSPVEVNLLPVHRLDPAPPAALAGESIDDQALEIDHYGPPQPEQLDADPERPVSETLVSDLLRSNCPVTGQPDWASVQIAYTGPKIGRAGLLRYLVGFREHAEFHEHCIERIFVDLTARCAPTRLSVYARYTRRGGLDINPWRATPGAPEPANARTPRQ